jgi:hypothetical protein
MKVITARLNYGNFWANTLKTGFIIVSTAGASG